MKGPRGESWKQQMLVSPGHELKSKSGPYENVAVCNKHSPVSDHEIMNLKTLKPTLGSLSQMLFHTQKLKFVIYFI